MLAALIKGLERVQGVQKSVRDSATTTLTALLCFSGTDVLLQPAANTVANDASRIEHGRDAARQPLVPKAKSCSVPAGALS